MMKTKNSQSELVLVETVLGQGGSFVIQSFKGYVLDEEK